MLNLFASIWGNEEQCGQVKKLEVCPNFPNDRCNEIVVKLIANYT